MINQTKWLALPVVNRFNRRVLESRLSDRFNLQNSHIIILLPSYDIYHPESRTQGIQPIAALKK